MPFRLAIVVSHPTQYYSPWFRHLAARPELELKVFYLWDFGVKETKDRTFGTSFTWDIPLLDAYTYEFLPNRSRDPGTHHFRGLDNPEASAAVAKWRPDALLLFGYNYATHLRLIVSPVLRRVPMWFRGDSHELCPAGGWKPVVTRELRRVLFRRFDCVLAVGQANAAYFRQSGVSEAKIAFVPHCVDNERFQAAATDAKTQAAAWKRHLGIPESASVLLFAGKFEEKKRPLDLLQAFLDEKQGAGDREQETGGERDERPEIGNRRSELRPLTSDLGPPSAVLLLVGSGPLESTLREAAGAELGKSVFFAPFQNQSQMPKVYAAGDVLVLPSFGRGETWGLAVNEAMNLGLPAIVSSHVGCGPDLILAGKTGWIFNAGDSGDLKATLAEVLADPARLKTMGQRAQTHIANFSYERATESFIAVIRKIRWRS